MAEFSLRCPEIAGPPTIYIFFRLNRYYFRFRKFWPKIFDFSLVATDTSVAADVRPS